jgi:hypothetical protein
VKVKFNENQCKASLLAVKLLNAAVAVILSKEEAIGRPLLDRSSDLMFRIGPNGSNLADFDLTPTDVDTLARALDATHFVYVLSPTLEMAEDEKQRTLQYIRQCKAMIK